MSENSNISTLVLKNRETPPRGYAFAAIVVDSATTANVYAVHLKSNYGATTAAIAESNRAKRTASIAQLLDCEKAKRGRPKRPVIVAGDMNADKWGRKFKDEEMFGMFESAGFSNPLGDLPPDRRGTHPSKKWGDSALDYVFLRGLRSQRLPHLEPNDSLSDHYALFVLAAP